MKKKNENNQRYFVIIDVQTPVQTVVRFNSKKAALMFYIQQVSFNLASGKIDRCIGLYDNEKDTYLENWNYLDGVEAYERK